MNRHLSAKNFCAQVLKSLAALSLLSLALAGCGKPAAQAPMCRI